MQAFLKRLISIFVRYTSGEVEELKILFHYPKTEKGMSELQKRIAQIHADAVQHCLQNLNCPLERKRELLKQLKRPSEEG